MRRSFVLGMTAALLSLSAPVYAAKPTSPSADQQEINAGRRIYQQYCAACHGANGEAKPGWQERDAQGELPPPPHGPEGHTWKHADGMLYRTIRDGWRDPFNKTKRQTMPIVGSFSHLSSQVLYRP